MAAKGEQQRLVRAAAKARELACAPYSKFKVGAALLTKRGEIVTGANVESASYGLTCCAERVALFKALTEGKKDFVAVAVVARCLAGRVGSYWLSMRRKHGCSWRIVGR